MAGERYFLEIHMRGVEANPFREVTSTDPSQEDHPHITIIRPFEIPQGQEGSVKQKIIDFCSGQTPIPFILEGEGNFNGEVDFIPVKSRRLYEFDHDLEEEIRLHVEFDKRLSKTKTLHLTIRTNNGFFPRTDAAMLRLTCLKDKKIWFSYDFVTHEVLDREQSLDEERWQRTKALYSQHKTILNLLTEHSQNL